MRKKFAFTCLLSEDTQAYIMSITKQLKKLDPKQSQGKFVEFAITRIKNEIEREGLEFVFGYGKKTFDI